MAVAGAARRARGREAAGQDPPRARRITRGRWRWPRSARPSRRPASRSASTDLGAPPEPPAGRLGAVRRDRRVSDAGGSRLSRPRDHAAGAAATVRRALFRRRRHLDRPSRAGRHPCGGGTDGTGLGRLGRGACGWRSPTSRAGCWAISPRSGRGRGIPPGRARSTACCGGKWRVEETVVTTPPRAAPAFRREPAGEFQQREMVVHRDARHAVEAVDHHRQQFAQGARVGVGDASRSRSSCASASTRSAAAHLEGPEIALDQRAPDPRVQARQPPDHLEIADMGAIGFQHAVEDDRVGPFEQAGIAVGGVGVHVAAFPGRRSRRRRWRHTSALMVNDAVNRAVRRTPWAAACGPARRARR